MSRAQKPRRQRGERFGEWALRRYIDSGGNGEVWEAENDQGRAVVVKVLFRFGGDSYARFKREVEMLPPRVSSVSIAL